MEQLPAGWSDAQPLQMLGPDGQLTDPGASLPLSEQELVEAFKLMLLSRQIDSFAVAKQRLGIFGTYGEHTGQEATLVGSSFLLRPREDWLVPQYREMPAMLRHGMPLAHFFLLCSANPAGFRVPDGVNALPTQVSLAAQIPHAVGMAWGLRYQGKPGIVATYFGDGASSEGDFHEALNLAGVLSAPVVFFMQNNGFAISTPVAKQSATASFAARARGYGFPGVMVDGNDILAVVAASRYAIDRAREGHGPTLLEFRTFRMRSHNTSDDQSIYIDNAELKRWAQLDPIARFRTFLTSRGWWNPELEEAEEIAIKERIDTAFAESSGSFKGEIRQIFENVYSEPHQRLLNQYESAKLGWSL